MKSMKKTIAVVVAIAMIFGCVIGGTVAWLIDKTSEVTNTFTVGNIDITLNESENLDLKMVPGNDITKDPKVTVLTGSEACWVFVEVTETNVTDFITYTIDDEWTVVPGETNVYYIDQAALTAANAQSAVYSVLTDDKVTVKGEVTKSQMDALTADNYPTLTFKAYAVQKDNIDNVADAWSRAKTASYAENADANQTYSNTGNGTVPTTNA